MANLFTGNQDIVDFFRHMDIGPVVAMQEDQYRQAEQYPDAPTDYEDAVDSYRRTLEIVGEIAGEFIEPRAEDVDRAGSFLADGDVCYAPGIAESLERLRQADLMGITLPRAYGGLNFPVTVSVTVKNTGDRPGDEIVQLYIRDNKSRLDRPEKELKAFRRVSLEPGEQRKVPFSLDSSAFSYYDPRQGGWVAEPGTFTVLVGSAADDIRVSKPMRYNHRSK